MTIRDLNSSQKITTLCILEPLGKLTPTSLQLGTQWFNVNSTRAPHPIPSSQVSQTLFLGSEVNVKISNRSWYGQTWTLKEEAQCNKKAGLPFCMCILRHLTLF